jgi:arylsulfatase A-like enzyme
VLLKVLKDAGYHVWWGGRNDLIPGDAPAEPYCHERVHGAEYRRPGRPEVEPKPAFLGQLSHQRRGRPGSDTYYSMFVGKIDRGDDDIYFDTDWANLLSAVDFVEGDRPADRPFLIYLGMSRAAPPFGCEEPWYSMIDRGRLPERIPAPESWDGKPAMMKGVYERRGMQSWSEDRWNELRACYYGMCARLDHQFGLLVDALKGAGIYDETAIFFFADHGVFAGDYGLVEKAQNVFPDCLTNVPLLVKPPAGAACRPRVSDALVELVDVPATVYDLTGVEPGYSHFGRSLAPVLARRTEEHRDAVFCEGGRLHGEEHCMETESYRPGSNYAPKLELQMQEGPEHGKAVMVRTRELKYVYRLYETDELYDLREDPRELDNRVGEDGSAGVVQAMKERALRFMIETADVVPHRTDAR